MPCWGMDSPGGGEALKLGQRGGGRRRREELAGGEGDLVEEELAAREELAPLSLSQSSRLGQGWILSLFPLFPLSIGPQFPSNPANFCFAARWPCFPARARWASGAERRRRKARLGRLHDATGRFLDALHPSLKRRRRLALPGRLDATASLRRRLVVFIPA